MCGHLFKFLILEQAVSGGGGASDGESVRPGFDIGTETESEDEVKSGGTLSRNKGGQVSCFISYQLPEVK